MYKWPARAVCGLGAVGAMLVGPNAKAVDPGNTLAVNKGLMVNDFLRSQNAQYRAVMQGDGNFVVYRDPGSQYVWGVGAHAGAKGVFMQGDGNLCINGASSGLWCNYSNGAVGNYFLMLRDSGDLEVYSGVPNDTPHASLVWTTKVDANYYANRYADLKAAFGTDAHKLMGHWITYGRFEGRAPNANVSDLGRQHAMSVNLDSRYYAEKYPDLKAAFGYDAERLYQHWMNNGRAEGRVPNKPTEDFLAGPPRSANGLSTMRVGDWLRSGETMYSQSRRYRLDVQPDAQFIIYEGAPAANTRRWWQNNRGFPTNQPYYVIMQADGHLCEYIGKEPPENRGGIACSPAGAGGPIGRYFAAVQDDGNLAIYKGGGPQDNRGWIWDRITTKPSSGFNWNAIVEKVSVFVTSTSNTVAQQTVATANDIGNEVAKGATKGVGDVVNTANAVANTTDKVAVQAGYDIAVGGKVIGNEVVKDGKIVGYAVAAAATEAWNYLNTNCGKIGRTAFPMPLTGYFNGIGQLSNLFTSSKVVDPATQSFFKDTGAANAAASTCFEQMQDGFYCAMPQELASFVVNAGSIPGNLLNLSTRVFNEAKTTTCLEVGAATVTLGALGLEVCAFGRVVVSDAQKAIACFSAAESKGIMKKLFASPGTSHSFPSKEMCNGIGAAALVAAEFVVTNQLSAEAKAATAAGKSNTAVQVADQLRTIYKVANMASEYNKIVNELSALPECNQK